VPFLDHELVELIAAMPTRFKIRNVPGRGVVTKYLLRRLAARYLDPAVVQQPKKGFDIPIRRWFSNGKLAAIERRLLGEDSRLGMLLNVGEIRRLLQEHADGGARGARIWNLSVLREWLEQHPEATV
jgi:asparagine synthase (glutamine-hydrolysing)